MSPRVSRQTRDSQFTLLSDQSDWTQFPWGSDSAFGTLRTVLPSLTRHTELPPVSLHSQVSLKPGEPVFTLLSLVSLQPTDTFRPLYTTWSWIANRTLRAVGTLVPLSSGWPLFAWVPRGSVGS